ncbi:MAG TPA: hypothetical protein VL225_15695 [Vicinamibacterales bacterium]|nr:hypothetical protein [Vicinamibacterales bacterium]
MATVISDTPKRDAPVVVDLGKQRRKLIKLLCRGEGPLMEDVRGCVEELRSAGTVGASAQPVIVIVRPKRRKRSGMFPGF